MCNTPYNVTTNTGGHINCFETEEEAIVFAKKHMEDLTPGSELYISKDIIRLTKGTAPIRTTKIK